MRAIFVVAIALLLILSIAMKLVESERDDHIQHFSFLFFEDRPEAFTCGPDRCGAATLLPDTFDITSHNVIGCTSRNLSP
jgi:hypothetical protein